MATAAPQINAGSMADIAFLLLIFFLVTTTMHQDEGINSLLPPKVTDTTTSPLHPRNVLEILINGHDSIFLEQEPSNVSAIGEAVRDFYQNPHEKSNLPRLYFVTQNLCQEKINRAKSSSSFTFWKEKEHHINLIGSYHELPKKAVVSLQNHKQTSYARYIEVYDAIKTEVNAMRDELSLAKFGVHFNELKPENPSDRAKILAIRAVYPSRLSEAEPYSSD